MCSTYNAISAGQRKILLAVGSDPSHPVDAWVGETRRKIPFLVPSKLRHKASSQPKLRPALRRTGGAVSALTAKASVFNHDVHDEPPGDRTKALL